VLSWRKKSDIIELANDVIISARADLSARAIVASIGGARFAYKIPNIIAYFSRRAFANGLAHGLP
jgi:nitrate/nitrite transporter NarK